MNETVPKWLVGALGILLVIFVGMLIVEKGSAMSEKWRNQKPANTISVSGEGRVEAQPDMAAVTIGVVSQGSTAEAVKNDNNRKINAIVAFVKQQGVAEGDIKTEQYFFNPNYDWRDGRSTITGYSGNQNVTVKFSGVDKSQAQLERVLEGVVAAGANQINGVNFSFKDPDGLRQQARKLAIEKARQKAQELAGETGLELGKIVSVSESGGSLPPVMPYRSDMAYGMGGAEAKTVAPDVQPGTSEITQVMTVVFEVK